VGGGRVVTGTEQHREQHPPLAQRPPTPPQPSLAKPSTFGPSALATPANAVTFARLLATPVFIAWVAVKGAGWPQVVLGAAIGLTDLLDGWIARRQGTTSSGAFLDPLVDKVVVVGVLAALAARGEIGWLPVALIAAREVSMSVYRSVMARRGVSIPARRSAKIKTTVQALAILLCLMPPTAGHHVLVTVGVWVAVAFTLFTGVQYVIDGRRAARAAAG
jgi:CDP-diacylglycerol--glycerol-3-phosphate 3-phosphatidyltransferase